mmetsp:Transcript_68142/g.163523  ORF Transcript_68142/g.163523 Transcript_68142/m.163523 type:complete len:175 (-) Transcript_68142:57-581(-)
MQATLLGRLRDLSASSDRPQLEVSKDNGTAAATEPQCALTLQRRHAPAAAYSEAATVSGSFKVPNTPMRRRTPFNGDDAATMLQSWYRRMKAREAGVAAGPVDAVAITPAEVQVATMRRRRPILSYDDAANMVQWWYRRVMKAREDRFQELVGDMLLARVYAAQVIQDAWRRYQ